MDKSLYRDHILQHYKEPHNFGAVDDPDRESAVENPLCGDDLGFSVAVEDGEVQDIRFEGSGCALSIAAASLLTDELQGASVERLKRISEEDVFALVGLEKDAISPMRVKCVLLCRDGVQRLVDDNGDTG
jgi:nitrogen fixation NifU-like protein